MAQIRLAAGAAAGAMTWIGLCLESEVWMGVMALVTLGLVWSEELAAKKGGEYGE